uniref:Uncharacterized protein n=1 Tax=Meloidogyne javanica TaxID=6303 RepID=A0A915MW84_MELJA
INCNDDGVCSGSGRPGRNTRCSGCYSCTYKGCCHRSYTDQWKCCKIPGWRADGYYKGRCGGI